MMSTENERIINFNIRYVQLYIEINYFESQMIQIELSQFAHISILKTTRGLGQLNYNLWKYSNDSVQSFQYDSG